MDALAKAAGIAVAGMVCAVLLRKETPELGMVLGMVVAVGLLIAGMDVFSAVLDFMKGIARMAGLSDDIVLPVVKTAGIAILTKITADICRDAKESAIASGVEIVGAAAGLYVILPLFQGLVDLMTGLLCEK